MEDGEAELALGEVLGKALVGRVVFRLQVGIVVPVGNTVKTQKKHTWGKVDRRMPQTLGCVTCVSTYFLDFLTIFFLLQEFLLEVPFLHS